MAAEYVETQVDETDVENRVLEALAEGSPFVFVVGHLDPEENLNLHVATGGGIQNVRTIRNLLNKTLEALPDAH